MTNTRLDLGSSLTTAPRRALRGAAGCGGDPEVAPAGEGGPDATFEAGPFTVEGGGEIVMCTYVRADNEEAEDVTVFETEQTAGGHHLIVYMVDHAIDLPPSACPQGGQPSWTQILTTQIERERQTFPEGVGFRIRPRQQFVIETHVINTSPDTRDVRGTFSMTLAEKGTVKEQAASYLIGTLNIDVPPNAAATSSATCSPGLQGKIHTMFGHQHKRGTGVRVELLPAGGAAAPLYETTEWEAPPIAQFEGGQALGEGDAIRVSCDWQNDSPERLRYPHEMCFAIGYYWPAQGSLLCASGGGTDDCQCGVNGMLDAGAGGARVDVRLTRKEEIPGAAGEIDGGAPIYCSLWRAEDWAGFFPKEGAEAYYFREAVDVPLATPEDEATFAFDDVTPGDYVVSCLMDTIGGGFYAGSGDVVNSMATPVTAAEGAPAEAAVLLDYAIQ